MTDIDVPVIGGPWVPAKDFFEKVQGAIENSHSHENSDALNMIDSEMLEKMHGVIDKSHEHENENVLKKITDDVFDDVGKAIANNHTHKNKAYLDTLSERPTATIELSAADGFINCSVGFVSMSEGSFMVGDFYGMHDENTLPVGTEIAKIEVRGQDDDPETGWVDLTEIYTRDESHMQGFYSKVFMSESGIKMFGGAVYQYCGDSFIVSELNDGKYPVARITYYTD